VYILEEGKHPVMCF